MEKKKFLKDIKKNITHDDTNCYIFLSDQIKSFSIKTDKNTRIVFPFSPLSAREKG